MRRRRPGMGDDEFVGGENGVGKRLVVFFFRLRIWGEAEGFGWDLALWRGGGLLRCDAVRSKGRAAGGLDTREGSRGASRGGLLPGCRFWYLVSSQPLLGSTVPILLSQSPLE